MRDLFSKPPEYTIDSSSLIELFNGDSILAKAYTPGLWSRLLEMIGDGRMISHIEVLNEIKKGDELYDWAHANSGVFKDYALPEEGEVIREMSAKYKSFVNAKVGSDYADPWLVAQAKCLGLTIVSQETFSMSPDTAKAKIPNVCRDPAFNVTCRSLFELVKSQGWTFV